MAKAASGTQCAWHPTTDSAPASPSEVAGSDFEATVLTHQAFVARLAQRILAWDDDVAEVVQDVFLAAYRHWPSFRREARITTWLASITLNACRTHRRRRWLQLRGLADVFRRTRTDCVEATTTDQRATERNDAVRRAVRSLPVRYREVVVLRYLEGLAMSEIELVLNRSRSTIDAQLSRGRAMLKASLADWMED